MLDRRLLRAIFPLAVFALLAIPAAAAPRGAPRADSGEADPGTADPAAIDPEAIRQHIGFFASDELRGRRGGSDDELRAAEYIARWFEDFGLEPLGDEPRSYIREFPLVDVAVYRPENARGLKALRPERRVVPLGCSAPGRLEGEAIFCGFGRNGPEHDDFAGVDLEGKVAVILLRRKPESKVPQADAADDRSLAARVLAAQERGAAGVVLVWFGQGLGPDADDGQVPPQDDVIPEAAFRALQLGSKGLSLLRDDLAAVLGTNKIGGLDPMVLLLAHGRLREALLKPGDRGGPRMPVQADPWALRRKVEIPAVAVSFAEALFLIQAPGFKLSDAPAKLVSGLGYESRPLGRLTRTIDLRIRRERVVSRNVAGVLRSRQRWGSKGGVRAGEAIVVGAHYDHVGFVPEPRTRLGRRLARREDYVWNGADDNASGAAALLELVRTADLGNAKPRSRDLVFVAFGSEEYGLLGSAAWVKSPPVPLENTVGMLNLDMVGRNPHKPVMVAGATSGRGLRKLVEKANAALGDGELELDFDNTYVWNSDQGSFLSKGVPAVFLCSGIHSDYHEASDEADGIDAEHAAGIASLARGILRSWSRAKRLEFDPEWRER